MTCPAQLSSPRPASRRRIAVWRALRWAYLSLLLLGFPATQAAEPVPQEPVSKEYQLKAAFLYNFTKFVEWPAARFTSRDSPIVIGVLGKNPFGDELAKVVQGRTVNGRAFVVQTLASTSEATTVHLLFVPRGQESLLDGQLSTLQAAGVLTAGESAAFATAGGIINFTTEADKIRFEINLDEAERGGLKISSQLLKLAKVVRRKSPLIRP